MNQSSINERANEVADLLHMFFLRMKAYESLKEHSHYSTLRDEAYDAAEKAIREVIEKEQER